MFLTDYLFGIEGIAACINLAIEDITCGNVANAGEPAAISLTPKKVAT